MRRPGRRASFALCLAAAILSASAASARTERFRWTHANASSVDNFRLYWGLASGSPTSHLDVGKPAVDSTGAFYYDLVVADGDTIYAVVSAWSSGLESLRSNEISRAGITGGPTPPPPPTPGANAAIVGFSLWNAQSDTLLDSSFQSGEAIPDSVRACVAIEIRGNAYVNADGPGSIRKVFDGGDAVCERLYPYAWEDGTVTAGQFACAASLSAIGSHTLTATPYDEDGCTGTVGTPMSITFTVSGPSASPTPTLGAPGQPYIVP